MNKSLITAMFFFFTISLAIGQEFKFKKEIEFSPIGNFTTIKGINFFNLGGTVTFRRYVNPKLALYGEFGAGFAKASGEGSNFSFKSYTFGIGLNYFFKENQKGFYANLGYSNGRTNFSNYFYNDDTWYGKVGLGYRINLSERLYLNLEQNLKFNFGEKSAFLDPRIGIGIRF